MTARAYGLGRGKAFPASHASSPLNPWRRLIQAPRDSDFVRFARLRAEFEPHGFELEEVSGRRDYTARFVNRGQP